MDKTDKKNIQQRLSIICAASPLHPRLHNRESEIVKEKSCLVFAYYF